MSHPYCTQSCHRKNPLNGIHLLSLWPGDAWWQFFCGLFADSGPTLSISPVHIITSTHNYRTLLWIIISISPFFCEFSTDIHNTIWIGTHMCIRMHAFREFCEWKSKYTRQLHSCLSNKVPIYINFLITMFHIRMYEHRHYRFQWFDLSRKSKFLSPLTRRVSSRSSIRFVNYEIPVRTKNITFNIIWFSTKNRVYWVKHYFLDTEISIYGVK